MGREQFAKGEDTDGEPNFPLLDFPLGKDIIESYCHRLISKGYTDREGGPKINVPLSKRRAQNTPKTIGLSIPASSIFGCGARGDLDDAPENRVTEIYGQCPGMPRRFIDKLQTAFTPEHYIISSLVLE